MIAGWVADLHAVLPVTLLLQGRSELSVDFVVDTGYTGFLSLPPDTVEALDLPYQFEIPATLADGSAVRLRVYEADVRWDTGERAVRVVAVNGRPLLGTAMLDQSELVVQFRDGGLVTVERL